MWGNQLQAGIYYVQLLLNGQPVKTIKAAKQ
jgi:outer membrane usher protein FimD/PapC